MIALHVHFTHPLTDVETTYLDQALADGIGLTIGATLTIRLPLKGTLPGAPSAT